MTAAVGRARWPSARRRAWPSWWQRPSCSRRVRRLVGALLVVVLAAACARGEPPDTPAVLLAEGRAGDQPWRLEGRRLSGDPCVTLVSGGVDRPAPSRCGIRRTALRHLDPMSVTVGSRLLVFSPLPSAARRVRIDGTDGSIRTVAARPAPGFPARFFVAELPPGWEQQTIVRVFAGGGRALIA